MRRLLAAKPVFGACLPYRLWQLPHRLRAFPGGPCRPGLRPTATSTAAGRQNVADKVGARHRPRPMVHIAIATQGLSDVLLVPRADEQTAKAQCDSVERCSGP